MKRSHGSVQAASSKQLRAMRDEEHVAKTYTITSNPNVLLTSLVLYPGLGPSLLQERLAQTLEMCHYLGGPKDHINTRISQPGSQAQDKGDSISRRSYGQFSDMPKGHGSYKFSSLVGALTYSFFFFKGSFPSRRSGRRSAPSLKAATRSHCTRLCNPKNPHDDGPCWLLTDSRLSTTFSGS